jgi:hypothetical protein
MKAVMSLLFLSLLRISKVSADGIVQTGENLAYV